MSNSLMIYLNKRLLEQNTLKKEGEKEAGPVITISREVGCNGLVLANLITDRLNTHSTASTWKVLSKEIFHESAKELNLEPERVRQVFKQSDKYAFDDILKAFGDRNYKSEQKIIKTVIDVVRSFAIDGFCIIVGRAGHVIAKDIKNALHIRLVAPLDYRIRNIMHNNRLNHEEAVTFIQRVEKERIAFRKAISEESHRDEMFDLCINLATFSDEEIIDLIEYAVDKKMLLSGYKPVTRISFKTGLPVD